MTTSVPYRILSPPEHPQPELGLATDPTMGVVGPTFAVVTANVNVFRLGTEATVHVPLRAASPIVAKVRLPPTTLFIVDSVVTVATLLFTVYEDVREAWS